MNMIKKTTQDLEYLERKLKGLYWDRDVLVEQLEELDQQIAVVDGDILETHKHIGFYKGRLRNSLDES